MWGARPGLSASQELVGRIKILPRPALPEQGIQHCHWRADTVAHPLIKRGVPHVGEPVQQSAPYLGDDGQ